MRRDACSAEIRGQVGGLQGIPGVWFYTRHYLKGGGEAYTKYLNSHLGTVYLNKWASLVTKPSLELSFQPFSTGAAGETRPSMMLR